MEIVSILTELGAAAGVPATVLLVMGFLLWQHIRRDAASDPVAELRSEVHEIDNRVSYIEGLLNIRS